MNKWLKIFLVILTFALTSILLYVILNFFNITSVSTLKTAITKSGKYGIIVYTLLLISTLVVFCFVPFLNEALTILGVVLFDTKVAFLSNLIAVAISTTILFFIGDKLGEKFARKLVGEKSLNEVQNLVDHKSKFWLPFLFIMPGIPDEAICLVAGMTKMQYWYLLLVSMIYHAVEIGICCFFGSGIINWSALSVLDWIVFINIILIDIFLLIKFEKYLEKKKNN